jgi:hypothetical protein
MQSQPALQGIQVLGAVGQLGEYLHLDRAQQGLRGPESQAHLHDGLYVGFVHFDELYLRSNWV